MIRVRFAPSPTGPLHVGGARTALFNYLLARHGGGKFILRIDDTDRERSRTEFEADIFEGLRWLGVTWDEGPDVGGSFGPYRQSERLAFHLETAEQLVAKRAATRDDDGAIRLRYPGRDIVVDDLVCGRCVFQPSSLGPEPVLVRSDGNPTYHLASVSDDIEMRITHVVRGQDHLTNTAKHLFMFEALGVPVPAFAHLPLILGTDGAKLSKRNIESVTSVAEFRDKGYVPEALANFLFLLGWSHPEAHEILSVADAVSAFSLDRVGKTASVFETAKLDWLNGQWIRRLSPAELARWIEPLLGEYRPLVDRLSRERWLRVVELIRGEIHSLLDLPRYLRFVFDEELALSAPAQERLADPAVLESCKAVGELWRELLSEVPTEDGSEAYDRALFSKLISQLKKRAPVQGKALFLGLRMAVTGDISGPDLANLAEFIPRQTLEMRAKGFLTHISAVGRS